MVDYFLLHLGDQFRQFVIGKPRRGSLAFQMIHKVIARQLAGHGFDEDLGDLCTVGHDRVDAFLVLLPKILAVGLDGRRYLVGVALATIAHGLIVQDY